MHRTLDRLPGDHATYVLGDGDHAVHLARTAPAIAVDIETAGLGADQWTVKAIVIGTTTSAVVLDPTDPAQRRAAWEAMASARELLMHNSPFDAPILYVGGFMPLSAVDKITDTLVSARLAYPDERVSKSLGQACERYLGGGYGTLKARLEQAWKAQSKMTKSQMFKVLGLSNPAYVVYAAFDGIMTARLHEALPDAVRLACSDHPFPGYTNNADYLIEREQTVNRMMLRRTCVGVQIDPDEVDKLKAEMRREASRADSTLAEWGIDINLTDAMLKKASVARLDSLGKLPRGHRRLSNGDPSADKRQLEKISHPIVDALDLRSTSNHFITYADSLYGITDSAGRIHPRVNVLAAATGRMSISDPPLQQLPPSTRRMMRFDADATSLDWSSIEPALFANIVGEELLIAEYEAGRDLYLPVAEAAGVDRKTAKGILLAQLYGQGVPSLLSKLGLEGNEDAGRALVNEVMGRMPRINKAIKQMRAVGNKHGKVITISGRVLPLPADYETGNRTYLGYKGVNFFIQGGAYDLLAEAVYSCHAQGLSDAVNIAVHDELVVDSSAADEVQRIMQTPPPALIEASGRTPILRTGRMDFHSPLWLSKE